MSFIAGYLSRTDNKYETDIVESKVKSYSIVSYEDSTDYENVVIETKLGHIIQKYKTNYPIKSKPYKDKNGNLLVTLGYYFYKSNLIDSQKILELCVENNIEVLEKCEGDFVFIFVEGNSGKVHIINDRFASRPFYILHTPDRIYFSSNLAFLIYFAGGNYESDILGWLQIFSYGHTIGTRTTFKDIIRIKPAIHIIISREGIQERQYWQLEYKPDRSLNPSTYSAQVFEAFKVGTALRAGLVGKGVIALSGGLDSRLVAASLPKDTHFSAFTFVDSTMTSDTAETRIATEISKILELEHHIEPTLTLKVSSLANDIIKLTGGLRPIHHLAKIVLYVYELRSLGLNFLLGGGPGDILAGSKIPSADYLDSNNVDKYTRLFCKKYALGGIKLFPTLALLFCENTLEDYFPKINDSILKSFENITDPTPAHRVSNWSLRHRWPAFTFISPFHNHPDVTEAFCHNDYRYVDLMLRLPADWLYQRNFYSFMIYNCLPQLRKVVYANTGKPLTGTMLHFNYKHAMSSQTIYKIVRYLAKKLIGGLKNKYTPYPFHYTILQKDEKLFFEIAEIIHSFNSLKAILDLKRCMQFLDNFKAGRIQSDSYNHDAELLGSLAAMCYSFKNLNS